MVLLEDLLVGEGFVMLVKVLIVGEFIDVFFCGIGLLVVIVVCRVEGFWLLLLLLDFFLMERVIVWLIMVLFLFIKVGLMIGFLVVVRVGIVVGMFGDSCVNLCGG